MHEKVLEMNKKVNDGLKVQGEIFEMLKKQDTVDDIEPQRKESRRITSERQSPAKVSKKEKLH